MAQNTSPDMSAQTGQNSLFGVTGTWYRALTLARS